MAVGLTVLPFAVSLVHLLVVVSGDYQAVGDLATSELYVRDVGRYLLTVGPYSRDGWFHPGPSYFYLVALPYRLLGGSSLAFPVTALVVNAASVVGMAAVARRRGGVPVLLCTLVACSLLLRAFGADFLRSAWNPHVTVLPYALLLFLTWAMLCGDRWALPVAAVVASFVAQTHIGYVALALPLLILGVAGLVAPVARAAIDRRRHGPAGGDPAGTGGDGVAAGATAGGVGSDGGGDGGVAGGVGSDGGGDGGAADSGAGAAEGPGLAGSEAGGNGSGARARPAGVDGGGPGGGALAQALWHLGPAAAVTVAAVAVMWVLPVYQQLSSEPGNLGEIVRYFRKGGETPSLVESWRVVAAQYQLTAEWLAGQAPTTFLKEPRHMHETVIPVLLVPVALAAVALWRRGALAGRTLVGVWVVGSVVAFVATVRTIGLVFAYRLGWAWVLGMMGGLLVLWAGWEVLVRRRGPGTERLLVTTALVVLAGLAAVNGIAAATAGVPYARESRVAAEIGPEVREWLPERDGVVVMAGTSFGALLHTASVRLDLERHGIDVRLPAGGVDPHGRVRTHRGEPVRAQLFMSVDGDAARDVTRPELEIVAYSGELTVEELRDLGERREALAERHRTGELTDEEYARRAARLDPQNVAVVVLAARSPAPRP